MKQPNKEEIARLLHKAKQGDNEAYMALSAMYSPMLRRIKKSFCQGLSEVDCAEVAEEAEIAVDHREARVATCRRTAHGILVLVETVEAAVRSELIQNRRRVSAASVGAVNVCAPRLDVEGRDGLGQECRYVVNFLIHSIMVLRARVAVIRPSKLAKKSDKIYIYKQKNLQMQIKIAPRLAGRVKKGKS